jgi:hypothetical protein
MTRQCLQETVLGFESRKLGRRVLNISLRMPYYCCAKSVSIFYFKDVDISQSTICSARALSVVAARNVTREYDKAFEGLIEEEVEKYGKRNKTTAFTTRMTKINGVLALKL